MARRRIFWHIGPDDLGTRFVAHALDAAREELADHDVLVAGTPSAWELGEAELRRNHQQLGYDRAEVDGQNAILVRRLWKHRGTAVMSMPGLAGATPDQIALALDGLRGFEIHLVLVARDLTSQVYAGAQAMLEAGGTSRPTRFADRVLDADGHDQEPAFWAGHDLPEILRRWTRTVLPEHVHLIAESDPDRIWAELTALLDVSLPLPEAAGHQQQLGPAGLDVLRQVVLGVDGRLDARGRRTALRDLLARELLPTGTDFSPVPGDDLVQRWSTLIADKEYDVHGTLRTSDAIPTGERAGAEDSAAAALAEALVEVARLRHENAELVEENLRLDRKRRKHKKRLKQLTDDAA